VENGIKPEYGLSESGFAQAAAAGCVCVASLSLGSRVQPDFSRPEEISLQGPKQSNTGTTDHLRWQCACRKALQEQLLQAGADPSAVLIYSSPFSCTLETAQTAAAAAGIDTTTNMHVSSPTFQKYLTIIVTASVHRLT